MPATAAIAWLRISYSLLPAASTLLCLGYGAISPFLSVWSFNMRDGVTWLALAWRGMVDGDMDVTVRVTRCDGAGI